MIILSFRAAPRIEYFERLKRIYDYLMNTLDYKLRFRTHQIDYSDVPQKQKDWFHIYGKVSELLPTNAPEPLDKPVTLTYYIDTNLIHNIITGRSITVYLYFINRTSID